MIFYAISDKNLLQVLVEHDPPHKLTIPIIERALQLEERGLDSIPFLLELYPTFLSPPHLFQQALENEHVDHKILGLLYDRASKIELTAQLVANMTRP